MYIVNTHSRTPEGLLERSRKSLQVRPAGHLWHHAAVKGVRAHLCGDHVGEDPALAVHYGDGRLVAGRLDSEDVHEGRTGKPSLRAASRRRSSRQTKDSDSGRSSDSTKAAPTGKASAARSVCVERSRTARRRTDSIAETSLQWSASSSSRLRARAASSAARPSRDRRAMPESS